MKENDVDPSDFLRLFQVRIWTLFTKIKIQERGCWGRMAQPSKIAADIGKKGDGGGGAPKASYRLRGHGQDFGRSFLNSRYQSESRAAYATAITGLRCAWLKLPEA